MFPSLVASGLTLVLAAASQVAAEGGATVAVAQSPVPLVAQTPDATAARNLARSPGGGLFPLDQGAGGGDGGRRHAPLPGGPGQLHGDAVQAAALADERPAIDDLHITPGKAGGEPLGGDGIGGIAVARQ
jgi:hypothetical protein